MELDELKSSLIDEILKSNDDLTSREVMEQADAIIRKCNVKSDDVNFNVGMAIYSFEEKPDCSLEERLALIDGMLFYSHTWGRDDEARKSVDVAEQISMTMDVIQKETRDKDIFLEGDYLYSSEGKAMVAGVSIAAQFYKKNRQKTN